MGCIKKTVDIKTIVERNDTVPVCIFDRVMKALILVSVITFSIETLPDLETGTRKLLRITEVVIVIILPLSICFDYMCQIRNSVNH